MENIGERDEPSTFGKTASLVSRRYQHFLDRSTIFPKSRWAGFGGLLALFFLRIYLLNGWFIVTYGLSIYLLNLFIGFLSPQADPDSEGPLLPSSTTGNGEFRPFSRRLSEFKFWNSATNATLISLFMTFFDFFDVPVFWPILLAYFLMLTFLTLRRQISHMIKYKYVPWSWGKTKYSTKERLDTPEQKEGGLVL